jgi:hypothetical protein
MKEDDIKREIDRMIDYRKPNYEPDDGPLSDEQVYQIQALNMNDLKFTTAGNYMDTKLEDLMYQSGLTAAGCWDQLDEYDRKAIEKFGELIVFECVKLAVFKGDATTGKAIKEHFGVKE